MLASDNLPEPDVIASEIAEDLRSVLEQMEAMLGDLEPASSPPWTSEPTAVKRKPPPNRFTPRSD